MSLEGWGDENPADADYDSWADHAADAGWIDPADYSPGVMAILRERERQETEEGWTPEHDDQHTDETLALVAALYATPFRLFTQESAEDHFLFEDPWPAEWDKSWDKRDQMDRRRKLVIAGALIAAEIDRLDRAEGREKADV
jgi:hypothetical protein